MEIVKYLNLGNNIEHKIKNSTLYKTGVLGYAENAIDKINMSDKGKDIFKNTVRVVTAGAIVLGACDRLPNKDSFTVTQPGTTPGLVVPPPDGTEISSGGVTTEAPFVTPISTEVSIVGYGGQLTVEQQAFTETQRAQGMKIGLENYVNYWEEFRVFADGTQLSLIPYPDQSDPTNINKMVYVAEVSGDLNYDGFVITIPIAQYQKYLETGDPQVMLPPQNAITLMENTDPFKMTKQVKEGSIPNLAGIPIGAVNGVMNGEFVYFAPGTTGALEVVGKLDENFKWTVAMESSLRIENLVSNKWRNYSIVENSNGYYEMKDSQGNLIPEVKLFIDGTAEIENVGVIAFQNIHVIDGKLIAGLRSLEQGKWSIPNTKSAQEMITSIENKEKDTFALDILLGHPKEAEMIKTMQNENNTVMTQEAMRAEYAGIKIEYNGETYDTDVDFNKLVPPKSQEIGNYSGEIVLSGGPVMRYGNYRIVSEAKDPSLGYNGKLSAIRPMQIGVETGWYNINLIPESGLGKWDENDAVEIVHAPVILVNSNGSFVSAMEIIDQGQILPLANYLSKEGRVVLWPRLTLNEVAYKAVNSVPIAVVTNTVTRKFVTQINQKVFEGFDWPSNTEQLKYKVLPEQFDNAIFN